MAMELSKMWQASDYRALFKRVDVATGCLAAKAKASELTEDEKKYIELCAKSCARFVEAYKAL